MEFLTDFNDWCSDRRGVPLPDQTFGSTRAQAKKALGPGLQALAAKQAELKPETGL